MLFAVLRKFGIPFHLCSLIINLHMGCTVKIRVGESDVEVTCTVGVKQGDNLAPILFIIFMQAALEIVHQKWERKKPTFRSKEDSVLTGRNFKICGKNGDARGCVTFEFYRSFYADDGAFFLESREDLLFAANLINTQFRRFGLACHIGYDDKLSKTEALYSL
jgi:hypothetical protein